MRPQNGLSAGRSFLWALLSAAIVAGCTEAPVTDAPVVQPAPRPVVEAPVQSAESRALQRFFERREARLLTQGLLRTDGGGVDTPYSQDDLIRNVEQIAFHQEQVLRQYYIRNRPAGGALLKWAGPVRIKTYFGPSVTSEQRAGDVATLEAYTARLARVTGHPISATSGPANFHVIFASRDDQDDTISRFEEIDPTFRQSTRNFLTGLSRRTSCFALTYPKTKGGYEIGTVIVVIRAELPDLTRQSCIHEELAQGLGPVSDSKGARPSIFNDDQEFAFLTTHDEDLLRLLYHPALKPGMRFEEARPLIETILNGPGGRS